MCRAADGTVLLFEDLMPAAATPVGRPRGDGASRSQATGSALAAVQEPLPGVYAELLSACTLEERHAAVRGRLATLGFHSLDYGRVGANAHGETVANGFCLTYARRAWAERYFGLNYHAIDPRIPQALRSRLPLVWDVAWVRAHAQRAEQDAPQMAPMLHALSDDLAAYDGASGVMAALAPASGAGWTLIGATSRREGSDWIDDALIGHVLNLFIGVHALLCAVDRPPAGTELSAVQRQILACVAEGLSDKQIASRLGQSASNVDYHLRQLRRRFNVRNRVQLGRHARRGDVAAATVPQTDAAPDRPAAPAPTRTTAPAAPPAASTRPARRRAAA
jgi:DNA-binding CsgD family transcriptional regulator